MNKIEFDEKLDFANVLIRPKRSTVSSRSDVDLKRKFHFKYSPKTWEYVPIMCANMDTVGTFGVYDCLHQYGMITTLMRVILKAKQWTPTYS